MVLPNLRTEGWLISDRELTMNNQKAPKAFLLFIVGYFKQPLVVCKELLVFYYRGADAFFLCYKSACIFQRLVIKIPRFHTLLNKYPHTLLFAKNALYKCCQ